MGKKQIECDYKLCKHESKTILVDDDYETNKGQTAYYHKDCAREVRIRQKAVAQFAELKGVDKVNYTILQRSITSLLKKNYPIELIYFAAAEIKKKNYKDAYESIISKAISWKPVQEEYAKFKLNSKETKERMAMIQRDDVFVAVPKKTVKSWADIGS